MECNTGKVINLESLYARFHGLVDKRKPIGKRNALATILLVMFLAKLYGEDKPGGHSLLEDFALIRYPAYLPQMAEANTPRS